MWYGRPALYFAAAAMLARMLGEKLSDDHRAELFRRNRVVGERSCRAIFLIVFLVVPLTMISSYQKDAKHLCRRPRFHRIFGQRFRSRR